MPELRSPMDKRVIVQNAYSGTAGRLPAVFLCCDLHFWVSSIGRPVVVFSADRGRSCEASRSVPMNSIELPRIMKRVGCLYLLVTGGRSFHHDDVLFDALDHVLMQCDARGLRLTVIQGGADGADRIARDWVYYQDGEVDLITEKADWRAHGRAAGPRRNQAMLDKYDPDYFLAAPGGNGTADMMRRCRAANVPGFSFPFLGVS